MPAQRDTYAYATRRGLRTRLATRFARAARVRRRELYLDLIAPGAGEQVVDVGCGDTGLATLEVPGHITGVDRVERPAYPGERFVLADAATLPLGDDEFDVAYSNSLIEHLSIPGRERAATELSRVGRRLFVQTPNRWFPIEPHALLPFVHWLPRRLGRRLWHLGVTGDEFDSIRLLSARDLQALFPDAEIVRERVGPLTKSLIAVRR